MRTIDYYEKFGFFTSVPNDDKKYVFIMFENITEFIKNSSFSYMAFNINGVHIDFLKTSLRLSKAFYLNHGMFNYLKFVEDLYKFLILSKNGYFDDVITTDNVDKTLIYLFMGYAIKSDWFLPKIKKILN